MAPRTSAMMAAFGLLVGAAACADPTGAGADRTRVFVHLTASGTAGASAGDAALAAATAADVVSAVVTVDGIYLQPGDGEPESGSGRVWLTNESFTVDLFDLLGDVAQLVADAEIPSGDYAQLRLVLSGGFLEVANGGAGTVFYATSPTYHALPDGAEVVGTLMMPSMAQSGLKVNFPGTVRVEGEEDDLLIDFDVSASLGHQAGASGMWVMQPVIRGSRVSD